jgi:hypothetical protein
VSTPEGVGEVREQLSAQLHTIRVYQARAIQEIAVKAEARHLPPADIDIHVFVSGETGSKVGVWLYAFSYSKDVCQSLRIVYRSIEQ